MEDELSATARSTETVTIRIVRVFLLGLFLFGAIGTGIELLLLDHTEKLWQRLPVVLLLVAVPAAGWCALARGRLSMRIFQGIMMAFVLSGLAGLWLHYSGNMEFELEMYPSLGGLELFKKAIRGATPALAPGTMIQLGLLGLAYTFRHPALQAAPTDERTDIGEK